MDLDAQLEELLCRGQRSQVRAAHILNALSMCPPPNVDPGAGGVGWQAWEPPTGAYDAARQYARVEEDPYVAQQIHALHLRRVAQSKEYATHRPLPRPLWPTLSYRCAPHELRRCFPTWSGRGAPLSMPFCPLRSMP